MSKQKNLIYMQKMCNWSIVLLLTATPPNIWRVEKNALHHFHNCLSLMANLPFSLSVQSHPMGTAAVVNENPCGRYLVWQQWTLAHSLNCAWRWTHWRCTLRRDSGSPTRWRFDQLEHFPPPSFLAGHWLVCLSLCSQWRLKKVARVNEDFVIHDSL